MPDICSNSNGDRHTYSYNYDSFNLELSTIYCAILLTRSHRHVRSPKYSPKSRLIVLFSFHNVLLPTVNLKNWLPTLLRPLTQIQVNLYDRIYHEL